MKELIELLIQKIIIVSDLEEFEQLIQVYGLEIGMTPILYYLINLKTKS